MASEWGSLRERTREQRPTLSRAAAFQMFRGPPFLKRRTEEGVFDSPSRSSMRWTCAQSAIRCARRSGLRATTRVEINQ